MTNQQPAPHAHLLPLKDEISETWLPHPAFSSCGIGKVGIILTLNADLISPGDEPALTALETQGVTIRREHYTPPLPEINLDELRSTWRGHPAFIDVGYADNHVILTLNKDLVTPADQPALDALKNWKVSVSMLDPHNTPGLNPAHVHLLPRKNELTETWHRHPAFFSCGIGENGIVLTLFCDLLSDREKESIEALKAGGVTIRDCSGPENTEQDG